MKRITKIVLLAVAVVLMAGLVGVVPSFWTPVELQAAAQTVANGHGHNVFTFDLAADCRTAVSGF